MRPLVTAEIESLTAYEAGLPIEHVLREYGVSRVVKLASNENPLGPSPRALEVVQRASREVHRYPDASAYELKHALAAELGVRAGEIVVGNGSNELLELLVRTFVTRDQHVVFADPSFVVYKMACLAQGVPFTAVPLRDFRHDLPAMARALRDETRVVFIANPNNPTGTYVTTDELTSFLAAVPREVIVALDEAYFEYADATDYPDGLRLRALHERLVVLRTFSKIHGLAGLRLGYAVMPELLADYVNRVRAPFNANSLAQAAGVAALGDTAHVTRSRAHNLRERAILRTRLRELGLRVVESQANFVFVDLGRPCRPVFEQLLRRGCIIRPMGETRFARISVGETGDAERLCTALQEVLS